MLSLSDIQSFFRGVIAVNAPLAPYTSMKVGGPADYFLEPSDKEDLVALIRYLRQQQHPYMIIGRGSNVIISDEGFRGAVINLESGLAGVALVGQLVEAESGARLTKLADFCIQSGLAGIEWAAGIPGSVGGAVVMNAGAHGSEIKDVVAEVEVFRGNEIVRVGREQAGFAYRKSAFVSDVVLSARFRLQPGNKDDIRRRKSELIARRNATQPLNVPNSGSMFTNPPGMFAAKLIEQTGLKGKRIGDAQVSELHANFMVNLGSARAEDVLKLIDLVRRTVHQNTGILLELEVKLVGFPEEVKAAMV